MARPPRLADATILDLIAELRGQHPVLTGARLRDELAHRFGHRGGVTRLYRLLRLASTPAAPPLGEAPPAAPRITAGDSTDDLERLRAQLAAALERAQLAEYREDHHQARWAGEIHELREKVRLHGDAAHRLRVLEQDVLDRSRELASAYLRIAELEARLR